jgi:tetrahydromethanopterin S-methyltransferase subunit G
MEQKKIDKIYNKISNIFNRTINAEIGLLVGGLIGIIFMIILGKEKVFILTSTSICGLIVGLLYKE